MLRNIFLIIILLSFINIIAQDTIYSKSGETIIATALVYEKVKVDNKKVKGYSYLSKGYKAKTISKEDVVKIRRKKLPMDYDEVVYFASVRLKNQTKSQLIEKCNNWLDNDWKFHPPDDKSNYFNALIRGPKNQTYKRFVDSTYFNEESSEFTVFIRDHIRLPYEGSAVGVPYSKMGTRHFIEYQLSIKIRNNYVRIKLTNIVTRFKENVIAMEKFEDDPNAPPKTKVYEYEMDAESYNKILCLCELNDAEQEARLSGIGREEIIAKRKEFDQSCGKRYYKKKVMAVEVIDPFLNIICSDFVEYFK